MFKPDPIAKAAWRVLNPLMPAGVTLYHAYQGDTEVGDFASVAITTRVRQGQDTRVEVNADGVQTYRGQRGGTITVQIVADDCNAYADQIINSLQMESASALFRQHGIVMHSANVVAFDPIELEGGQFMQMAAIDLQWRAQVQYYDEVGLIEYVVADYKVLNPNRQQIGDGHFAVALGGAEQPVYAVKIGPLDSYLAGQTIPRPALWKKPHNGDYTTAAWKSDAPDVLDITTTPHGLNLKKPGRAVLSVELDTAVGLVTDNVSIDLHAFIIPLPSVVKAGTIIPQPRLILGPLVPGYDVQSYTWESSDYGLLDIHSQPYTLEAKAPGTVTVKVTANLQDGTHYSESVTLQII